MLSLNTFFRTKTQINTTLTNTKPQTYYQQWTLIHVLGHCTFNVFSYSNWTLLWYQLWRTGVFMPIKAPYPDPPPANGPKSRKGYLTHVSSKSIKDKPQEYKTQESTCAHICSKFVQLSHYINTCPIKRVQLPGAYPEGAQAHTSLTTKQLLVVQVWHDAAVSQTHGKPWKEL